MRLDKKDWATIIILMCIFLSVSTWNLGSLSTPISSEVFSSGEGFVVDLGEIKEVKSVNFLLKEGSFNLSLSVGLVDEWRVVSWNNTFSNYYKWHEVKIFQNTQFVKVEFESLSSAEISEVAVIDGDNQLVEVAGIFEVDFGEKLTHLYDEQYKVDLPATFMSQTYFDEIYFVRTAEQYLTGNWPYEWTHPPLGKLIQAVGIGIFGYSPFGWRFMGVIFATLMLPVMYLIGKQLFGNWIGAFAATFLFTFDFMHFTMGRMGTVDTFVVFFALLSQLCFLVYFKNIIKKGWGTSVFPLFLAFVFFGLGFATKWLVFYGAIGMLFLLVILRLKDTVKVKGWVEKYLSFFDYPFLLFFGFLAVAIGIYFLSYIPDMLIGRPFVGARGVIDVQFAMFNYHATLTAQHPFESSWWSWPFMVSCSGYVPLWVSTSNLLGNMRSTIAVFGNPAVWWGGFASIIVVAISQVGRKIWRLIKNGVFGVDYNAVFILTLFFFSWLSYAFISRATFIYHFYLSVPYLCLGSAYLISKYWNRRLGKVFTFILFTSVIVLFIVFFSVISGLPTSDANIEKLRLFGSWMF